MTSLERIFRIHRHTHPWEIILTSGIHDTVTDLDISSNTGNGFLFKHYDSNGLSWAIDQAMRFYDLPDEVRKKQIKRIMLESKATFNHEVTANQHIDLYEKILNRILINP